jgi:hypothetical protein
MIPAALMPLVATSQVSSSRGSHSSDTDEQPSYKYEAYAGYGYTSLNQVNQSRSGLQGVDLGVTRDFGRYFGITADGAYYRYALEAVNPGDPSVYSVLFGPEFHAELYGRYSGFVHALIGFEHTGGESETPNLSFAGGAGGGVEYKVNSRFSVRASGDDIAASFSATNNSPGLGYSPHRTRDARATVGVVYRF